MSPAGPGRASRRWRSPPRGSSRASSGRSSRARNDRRVDTATAAPGALLGRVGIVFATPANQLSASKLTVREELAFGLENLGVPRDEMDARIDAALARLASAHLADREPFALSGGEQQRVAIASIVAMGTDVLVLDEPTAQLDPAGTASVADLLDELARTAPRSCARSTSRACSAAMDRCSSSTRRHAVALDRPGAALPAAEARGRPRAADARPRWPRPRASAGRAFDEAAIAAGLLAAAGLGRGAAARGAGDRRASSLDRRPRTRPPVRHRRSRASSIATRAGSRPSAASR